MDDYLTTLSEAYGYLSDMWQINHVTATGYDFDVELAMDFIEPTYDVVEDVWNGEGYYRFMNNESSIAAYRCKSMSQLLALFAMWMTMTEITSVIFSQDFPYMDKDVLKKEVNV